VAILPVQLNGRTCDVDALQAVADHHGIAIVEDAAQGLGSKFKGRMAGSFGCGARSASTRPRCPAVSGTAAG
jgi:dTDP-4-amino-4,6-dideoxygalactose transaminase